MIEFLMTLFIWVTVQTGTVNDRIPRPIFVLVTASEMAVLICGNPMTCDIQPAYYTGGEEFYVMDDIDFKAKRLDASFVVHHLVHYVQVKKFKKKKPQVLKNYMEEFEYQAVDIQRRYLGSVDI